MPSRYWQILKAWAMRPLNWLFLLTALLVSLSSMSRPTVHFADAFENAQSRKPKETLDTAEKYLLDLDSRQTDFEVEGLDLSEVCFIERDGQMTIQDFQELEAGIANYPNTKWILFGDNQLNRIRPGTLRKVPKVTTVVVPGKLSDQHLDRLLEIRSLEHLTIRSNAVSGSLAKLGELPKLETVVFIGEQRNFPDSDSERVYGPESFRELEKLPHLKRLVLLPPWFDSLVFHPDTPPSSSMEPVFTGEMLESLKRFPNLEQLTLGAIQTAEQHTDLRRVATALPSVSVRPGRYNDRIVTQALMSIGVGFAFVMFLYVFGLAASFSSPQSLVIPHHQTAHLRFSTVFCLLATVVAALVTSYWTSLAFVPILSLALLATIYVLLTCRLLTFARTTPATHYALSLVALVPTTAFLSIFGVSKYAPVVMLWIEQFLSGHYIPLALFLIVPSAMVVVWQLWGYRRNYIINAEAGMKPIITVRDFGTETTSQAMLHQDSRLEVGAKRWKKEVEKVQQMPPGWSRSIQLLSLGDSVWDFKRMIGAPFVVMTLLIAVSYVVPIPFPYALLAAYGSTSLMLGASLGLYSKRDVLSLELLRPRSRRTFVRQHFALVLLRTGCAGLVAVGCTLTVRMFQGPPVTLQSVLLCVLALVACTLLFAGLGLWGVLLRKIWSATPAATLVLLGLCAMCWLLTDGQPFYPRSKPIDNLFRYAGIYSLPLTAIAILTITSAYWKWLHVEFEKR